MQPSDRHLKRTPLLDFDHPSVAALVRHRQWKSLDEESSLRAVYNFVKDEIKFGYNTPDIIPASKVLALGRGECNSKGILLMALLRACGIPCRFHAFWIDKSLQQGAMPARVFRLLAPRLLHSWVEAKFRGKWIVLEGVILDREYLAGVQEKFRHVSGPFCGYAVATQNLQSPGVEWTGGNTFVQSTCIVENLGLHDSPDDYFRNHPPNVRGLKAFTFRLLFLRTVNANVQKIRSTKQKPDPGLISSTR